VLLSERLKGKVAVVTGTGSGIGQGCALMFARHGAQVMGCDINAAAAQATVGQARQQGISIDSCHPCDLTDAAQVEKLMGRTAERFGGIDVLVNAGAFGAFGFIEQLDHLRDWKRTLSGELDVVFLVASRRGLICASEGAARSSTSPVPTRMSRIRSPARSRIARGRAVCWQ